MSEVTEKLSAPKSEPNEQIVDVGEKEKLSHYLLQTPLAIHGIGLGQYELQEILPTFERIKAGEIGEIEEGELAKIAAAVLTDEYYSEEAGKHGVEVVFEEYDVEEAVENAASAIKILGGEISREEEIALAKAILLVPYPAMKNFSGNGNLYGKVCCEWESGSLNIFGIAIADRNLEGEVSPGAYRLEGKKIVVRSTDKSWKRKVAHEMVHDLRYARKDIDDSLDEGFAALAEYIAQAEPDQRMSRLEELGRLDLSSEIKELENKTKIEKGSTKGSASSVLKIVETSQKTGISIREQFAAYINPLPSG